MWNIFINNPDLELVSIEDNDLGINNENQNINYNTVCINIYYRDKNVIYKRNNINNYEFLPCITVNIFLYSENEIPYRISIWIEYLKIE